MISNNKLQLPIIFILLISSLMFIGCKDECVCDDQNNNVITEVYPTLRIVNENTGGMTISDITLVDYEFSNLSIDKDESQDFTLNRGMIGGYDDIYVTVYIRTGSTPRGKLSGEFNFVDGETTTITLKGCTSEGCDGYSLE